MGEPSIIQGILWMGRRSIIHAILWIEMEESIYNFTGIIHETNMRRGGAMYNGIAIIDREGQAKGYCTRAIYKIEGSTVVVNYQ